MSPRAADVVVAGGGAMGSAAAWRLASAGLRTVVLDAHAPPHAHGSTHGESRIIREAYFEDPVYVPLVRRAFDLWEELERGAGESLLLRTGVLALGPEGSGVVRGTLRSVEEHGIAHELLEAGEVARRFPALRPPPGILAILERRGGVLRVEACVAAQLRAAVAAGAELRTRTQLTGWSTTEDGVEVRTASGTLSAGHLVLALGPWLPAHLPEIPLRVERQVQLWFEAAAGVPGGPEHLPAHLWETPEGRRFYGVPDLGSGLKAALHHEGETTTPDAVRREVDDGDVVPLRELLGRNAPGYGDRLRHAATCLYTNTPDDDFVIDHLPGDARVVVLSPCSGHGFKFAPAVGEAAAALVRGEEPPISLERFSLSRFATPP